MAIAPRHIEAKPRSRPVFYPVSDGEPLGETDRHVDATFYGLGALKVRYADRPDVYVAADNFLYYEEGNPKRVVSPDCYLVFGSDKKLRDCYMTWLEDGRTPAIVFEITSKSTKGEDIGKKFDIYERVLRVPEYILFDPTGEYLNPRLKGYRLDSGHYAEIPLVDGRLHSEQLALDIVVVGEQFRFFDPETGKYLPNDIERARLLEAEVQRANSESRLARAESERADREARRVEAAEAEISRLRADLEELRRKSGP